MSSSLERNRVFDRAALEEILYEGVAYMKEASDCTKGYQRSHALLKSAYERIPEAAKDHDFGASLDAFTAQDFDTTSYDNMAERLNLLIGKLQTDAFACDEIAATELENITAQTKEIAKMVQDLKELLAGGTFTNSYDSFTQRLEDCQTKWEQKTISLETRLSMATTMLKGMEQCSAYSKDPVNLSTGNLIYTKMDIAVAGSPKLHFTRFYNSMDMQKNVLGRGYMHNYAEYIRPYFDIVHIQEDGKEETYEQTQDKNIYQGKRNTNKVFYKNPEGYQYTQNTTTKYFNEAGRLIKITEEAGGTLNLIYNEAGQLEAAERSTKEALFYSYDQAGNLIQVADHTGRSVTFTYEKKKLATVTDPCGNTTRYTYAENNRLKEIISPQGIVSLSNSYDSNKRCVSQQFPDGGIITYEYKDDDNEVIQTEPNNKKTTYIHDNHLRNTIIRDQSSEERYSYDSSNNRISFTDKGGNTTKYQYNEDNRISAIENPLGEKIEIYHGQNITTAEHKGTTLRQNIYDHAGRLIFIQNEQGGIIALTYGKHPYPEKILYPDQSTMKLSYDERHNLTTLISPDGSKTDYSYDSLNRVTAITDGLGNQTSYQYDPNGRITTVTRADQSTREYRYNPQGSIEILKDYDENNIKLTYYPIGTLSSITNKSNYTKSYRYDTMGNLIEQIDEAGAKTNYRYDENNLLREIINDQNQSICISYDAVGNKKEITDPCGNTTRLAYDANNQLISITDSEGNITSYQYDTMGNLIQTTYPDKSTVQAAYDMSGNLLSETNEEGETTHYTYTFMGKLSTKQDPCGGLTTYHYQAGGRLTGITKPDGTKENYTYDPAGNLSSRSDHLGNKTTYEYDCLNRLQTQTDNQGNHASYTYDPMGNITSIHKNGAVTTYCYTPEGQLEHVTDPCGSQSHYTYDPCGRIIRITQTGSSGSQSTTLHRNPLGQIQAITNPAGQTKNYSYDPCGRLSTLQEGDGKTTAYCYTPSGKLKQIQYPDQSTAVYQYDQRDRLIQLTDWLGTTTMHYDKKGRMTGTTDPEGNTMCYAWDANDRQTEITYPDQSKINFRYDALGKLTAINSSSFNTGYHYDDYGRLLQKNSGSHLLTDYTYNETGRICSITHKNRQEIIETIQYTYEKEGRHQTTTHSGSNSQQYKYTYDQAGRLIKTEENGETKKEYTYDSYGNRTTLTTYHEGKAETIRYQYNALNQLLSAVTEQSEKQYRYDTRGNLIEIAENQVPLVSYRYGVTGMLEEVQNRQGYQTKYQYNALKQRIKQIQTNPDGSRQSKTYLPDLSQSNGQLLGEIEEGNPQPLTQYLWDTNIAGIIKKEQQSYYLNDCQGSPLYLYDRQTNRQTAGYRYDEYGNSPEQETSSQPFGYTGYYYDPIGKSYYAKAREYDPETGRFNGEDEEGYLYPQLPCSINKYHYCMQNPLSYTDPGGHEGLNEQPIPLYDIKELFQDPKSLLLLGANKYYIYQHAIQMAKGDFKVLLRMQYKQKYGEEVEAFWNQKNGYFEGTWWQDPTKLEAAYNYLQKETSYANLSILSLAERFQEGVADPRMQALQTLIGIQQTGMYDSNTMIALKSVLLSRGMTDIDDFNPALNEEALNTIKEWHRLTLSESIKRKMPVVFNDAL